MVSLGMHTSRSSLPHTKGHLQTANQRLAGTRLQLTGGQHSAQLRPRGRDRVCHAAAATQSNLTAKEQQELDEDIRKLEDRESWYTARFIADDAPDWNPATFVSARQLANGLQAVELDIEISRERVPLRNAYRHVGQTATVRVNSGEEHTLRVATAPFPLKMQQDPLYFARGDLTAGEVKAVREPTSVIARLEVIVPDGEAKDLMEASAADAVEVGPFQGAGLNLRGDIIGAFRYRTIIILCEGAVIATAKALIEADSSVGGLNFPLRENVVLYYRAQNEASLAYKSEFERWQSKLGVRVETATRDAFIDMFDGDDQLEYEPASTAAIILAGGDEDAEKAAMLVCSEAEITEIVKDSEEAVQTEYLEMRTHNKGMH